MKKNRIKSSKIEMENRKDLSYQQDIIPLSKISSGSLENKYPVVLDGGKTVIYISDRKREWEIKLKYTLQKGKRSFFPFVRPEPLR
jgi:hypothetical protein